jgi:tRNA(fMet)-specific endonuclease VapC
MFLLDTDHIAIVQRQTQPEYGRLSHRMGIHPPTAFYYSIVSLHEQTLGANLYVARARDIAGVLDGYRVFSMLLTFFCQVQVLSFDMGAAAMFNVLRAQKVRIGTMDLRIAAIALTNNLTVLTRNLRDFTQVPGLTVEDWTT